MDSFFHEALLHFRLGVEIEESEDNDSTLYDTSEQRLDFENHLEECLEALPLLTDEKKKNIMRSCKELIKAWSRAKENANQFRVEEWTNCANSENELDEMYYRLVYQPLIASLDDIEEIETFLNEGGADKFKNILEALKVQSSIEKKKILALAKKAKKEHGNGKKGFFAFVFSLLQRAIKALKLGAAELTILACFCLSFYVYRLVVLERGISVENALQETVLEQFPVFTVADLAQEMNQRGFLSSIAQVASFQEKEFLLDRFLPSTDESRLRFSSAPIPEWNLTRVPLNLLKKIIPYEKFASKNELEVLDKIPLNLKGLTEWMNAVVSVQEKFRLQKERQMSMRKSAEKVIGKSYTEMAKILTRSFWATIKGANVQSLVAEAGSYLTNRIFDNFGEISVGLAKEGASYYARSSVISVAAEYQRKLNKNIFLIVQSIVFHLILQAVLKTSIDIAEEKKKGSLIVRLGKGVYELNRFYYNLNLIVRGAVVFGTDYAVEGFLKVSVNEFTRYGTLTQGILLSLGGSIGMLNALVQGKDLVLYLLTELPKIVSDRVTEQFLEEQQPLLKDKVPSNELLKF